MIGTAIVVLTTHRQTRRQIARALMSAGSTTHFVESAGELNEAIARVRPNLLILDTDDGDSAVAENVIGSAGDDRPSPVVLLSMSKDKQPLANLLERHDISNLVAKHGAIRASYPVLDERELVVTCEKVLQRNIFGIDKYVGNWGVVIHHVNITSPKDKGPFLARFEDYLIGLDCPKMIVPDIITVADELIMNAIVHAPRDEAGRPKYEELRGSQKIVLTPEEYVQVAFGCDGQRLMLSVTDNFGTLDKKKVHAYLSRAFGPPLTPETKPSGAGIGLSMSFRSIHQLIFNVQESKRTEAIAGWYLDVNTGAEFRQVGKSLNLFWLPSDSAPLIVQTSTSALSVVYLPPKIDEHTDFSTSSPAMLLDMGAVKSMTSRGLVEWMTFLRSVKGHHILVQNCPQVMVRQSAMVRGVLDGLLVQTVLVPFACASCGVETEISLSPNDVLSQVGEKKEGARQSSASRACTSCGKDMSFSGMVEEYEAFLRVIAPDRAS